MVRLVAIAALAAAFCASPAVLYAEARVAFDCPSFVHAWGSVQTFLSDGTLDYDTHRSVIAYDACEVVDEADPRAQWDIHLDDTGTLHAFQWPHPDLPTEPGQPFVEQLNLHVVTTLSVAAGRSYRLDPLIRPDPVLSKNHVLVDVECPGAEPERFYSWAGGAWPPLWTAPESGSCLLDIRQVCHQPGLPGGIDANPRGECHNDLVPYRITGASCGLGVELLPLGVLLWRVRRGRS